MSILFKNLVVIDPTSLFDRKKVDILIKDGIISKIAKKITEKVDDIFDKKDCYISPGWMDIYANFNQPGHEERESIATGAKAAAKGGFTEVCLSPHTTPSISHHSILLDILHHNNSTLPIKLRVGGSFFHDNKKNEFANIYELNQGGAIYFSNGELHSDNNELLLKILLYIKGLDAPVFMNLYSEEKMQNVLTLETKHTYSLGLKNIPVFWEKILGNSYAELLEYSKVKGIIHGFTSTDIINNIKKRKKANIKTSIATHNLLLSEHSWDSTYNSNYKLLPPLTEKVNINKLKNAFLKGDIDFIASHHSPKTYDEKVTDINTAAFGMASIQYAYNMVNTAFDTIDPRRWVEAVAIKNRAFLGVKSPSINVGNKAEITIFSPNHSTLITQKDHMSKSLNIPFFNQELKGKVFATYYNNKLHLN